MLHKLSFKRIAPYALRQKRTCKLIIRPRNMCAHTILGNSFCFYPRFKANEDWQAYN